MTPEKASNNKHKRGRGEGLASKSATRASSAASERPDLVLIAEDEEGIALALEILIEDAGYRVVHAAHGERALSLARALHPALVLTDLMMPRMSGAELIERLRDDAASHGGAAPRIVLMTAARNPEANEVRADAFLPKPFDVEQVIALLDRFLPAVSA